MIHEDAKRLKVQLKGLSSTPDDYLCEDGELAGAMNVENVTGGTQSAACHAPVWLVRFPQYEIGGVKIPRFKFLAIHTVQNAKHGIVMEYANIVAETYKPRMWWFKMPEEPTDFENLDKNRLCPGNVEGCKDVTVFGNMLLLKKADGTRAWVKWTIGENGSMYKYLGENFPDLQIRFGLKGHNLFDRFYAKPTGNHNGYKVDYPGGFYVRIDERDEGEREKIYYAGRAILKTCKCKTNVGTDSHASISERSDMDAIYAEVNRFIEWNNSETNRFTQPFLVRYCYELCDGTKTFHSSPVFMLTSSYPNPYIIADKIHSDGGFDTYDLTFHIDGASWDLTYLADKNAIDEIKRNWGDVIKGIHIYVSQPIYLFNQNSKDRMPINYIYDAAKNHYTIGSTSISSIYDITNQFPKDKEEFALFKLRNNAESLNWDLTDVVEMDGAYWAYYKGFGNVLGRPKYAVNPILKTEKEILSEITDAATFFKLKSYTIEELQSDVTVVEIKDGYLSSLVSKEAMTDEYHSHDTLASDSEYVYNSRLNMAGIKRTLWNGWNPLTMVPYQNPPSLINYDIQMAIRTIDNDTCAVKSKIVNAPNSMVFWPWMYFPNENAKTVELLKNGEAWKYAEMEPHSALNGSFMFEAIGKDPFKTRNASDWPASIKRFMEGTDMTLNATIDLPSKLYTSNVNNPFVFEPKNINTVGSGRILGMAAATKALSQGQQGQFPLHVMTDEGIWIMEVSATGGWSAKQTATRDVVTNGDVIFQIDDAIIFPTVRGLMIMQGNDAEVLTKELYDLQKLTNASIGNELQGKSLLRWVTEQLGYDIAPYVDHMLTDKREWLTGDDLILHFDGQGQRVIASRVNEPVSMVYSLDAHRWTMVPWKLTRKVNSYPQCYAIMEKQDGDSYLVDMSHRATEQPEDNTLGMPEWGIMVTRPIKTAEYRDELKELNKVVVHGRFDRQKVQMVWLGTMDYKTWYVVGSSKSCEMTRRHGQAFRAYVGVILAKMDITDHIDDVELEYRVKPGKLRGGGY